MMAEFSVAPSGRPAAGEYAAYAHSDIALVAGGDAVAALMAQQKLVVGALGELEEEAVTDLTYEVGKWTLKEVLGHLADDERIFAYRGLCLARGDVRPLPGFDENAYMKDAGFEARSLAHVLEEYCAVRQASIAFFRGLSAEAWRRRGEVNGYRASVRGLAFHIAGHELHHLRVLEEKYLPRLA